MTEAVEINGKKLLPIKQAVSKVSYSRDYVTRLAREGKIVAINVGRQWFVDMASLESYSQASEAELEIRKKRLSEERRQEKNLHEALEKKKVQKNRKEKYLHIKTVVAAMFVLACGLASGFSVYNLSTEEAAVASFEEPNPVFIDGKSNLASASKTQESEEVTPELFAEPSFSVEKISEDISEGVLLLPEAALSASVTDMFSDEVQVLTNGEGVQVVVRVDENGQPIGNVIPFVKVPVKYSDR